MSLQLIPVVIGSGASLSPQVNLGNRLLVGISMPSGWDAASLSFQASPDGGTTFQELQTTSAAVSITAAASQFIAIDPSTWRGVNCLKVRSGTAGAPVNQTANRTLNLVVA